VRPGAATDLAALRAFARGCAAVTLDHEQVPQEHLRALVAEGVSVHPGPDALVHAQDKLVMRRRLAALGIPGPRFAEITAPDDLVAFGAPAVLKAVRGGYDGRGVWLDPTPELVAELLAAGTPLMAEERVPMRRELAALVARSPFGQAAAWPVVETVQADGQCVEVLAPAPGLPAERAAAIQELALKIADALGVTGLLAVELFETADGVVVNELAMRPHNSGHWTIEGARTSQFEQHLRAVLDYPLGATTPTAPAVVMANVLGAAGPVAMSWTSGCTTSSPASPTSRCTSTASPSGPPARSGTSRRWARRWTRSGDGRRWPRAGSRKRCGRTGGRSTTGRPGRGSRVTLRRSVSAG
jgi:5-(carboxyamino)imidazole ribonucleotide synthase